MRELNPIKIQIAVAGVLLAFLSIIGSSLEAQEDNAPALTPAPASQSPSGEVKLRDFETLIFASLREQFPRFPGLFASVHTCHLPDYGPLISVTIQPPLNYFTRPVLLELERRQRIAEEQAKKIRTQIDRASQLISLKAKEADLVSKLQEAQTSKKVGKAAISAIQADLTDVRKSLQDFQSGETYQFIEGPVTLTDGISEVDLNKMLAANYQDLIMKLTETMKNCLCEYGPALKNLKENEKLSITTYVRDNFLGYQERGIIFVLNGSDVLAYRRGALDLAGLKKKIVVQYEKEE
jgi:hypothetical protein